MSGSSNCMQAQPSVLPLKTEDYNCKLDIGYWNFSTFRFFLIVAQNFNQAMSPTPDRPDRINLEKCKKNIWL